MWLNKKSAKPHEGFTLFVVRLGGFEPPAFGTGIQRSIHLSYKRIYRKDIIRINTTSINAFSFK